MTYALAASLALAAGPNVIYNGSFDICETTRPGEFFYLDGQWSGINSAWAASGGAYSAPNVMSVYNNGKFTNRFYAVKGTYEFSLRCSHADRWSSPNIAIGVDGAKKSLVGPSGVSTMVRLCATNAIAASGAHVLSVEPSRAETLDDLAVRLVEPAAGALEVAVEPQELELFTPEEGLGGRVFADGESKTYSCPLTFWLDAAHSAYVTCTGYRVETWDAEAVDWSVESTVTTPSGDAFSYVHTGDGVTAKRLVWTFGARTAAFSPTHVWAGGDLIDPLDFSVAANWRTASGQAVSAAPGVDSVVYVPPAVAPTGVTTVEVVQAFHVAALHVGDPAGADKGYARLVFRTSATNEVDGALVVYPRATLTHEVGVGGVNVAAGGTVSVWHGGVVDVLGCGPYNGGKAQGDGSSGCGASHGGVGKGKTVKCYGDVRHPVDYGSGGYNGYWTGWGGGVVFVKADGVLSVDGEVRSGGRGQFGGSGGSVQLRGATVNVAGMVTANGSGTSAGGRIALYQTEGTDWSGVTGTVQARSASDASGAGTVYRECAADAAGRGELIVDNLGNRTYYCAVMTVVPGMSEPFGRITVRNGRLRVVGAAELPIAGELVVEANGIVDTEDAAGHIVFAPGEGASVTVRVDAAGTFSAYDLRGTVPDGIVYVADGSVLTCKSGGTLTLGGTEELPFAMLPVEASDTWSLNVLENVVTDVRYVAVSNSIASGAFVTAYDSMNLGGNEGWAFLKETKPGDPLAWTGAKDTVWSNGGNWDPQRVPCETDVITIPSGCPRYPVLTATFTANVFRVDHEAAFTLSATTLAVTNRLSCGGAFTCTGAARVELTGDADFTNATLTAGSSVFSIRGTSDQVFAGGGQTFATLLVERSGGRVAFFDGFSAGEFRSTVRGAAQTFAFESGRTVTAAVLALDGLVYGNDAYSYLLSLVSGTQGSRWGLNVTERYNVRGVQVRDSDATAGLLLNTGALARNLGNNDGWNFDSGSVVAWTGTAGTGVFDDPGNWMPAGVPGASSSVRIATSGGETVTVGIGAGAARTLAGLAFDTSSGGTILVTNRANLTVSSSVEIPARVTVTIGAANVTNAVTGNVTIRSGGTLDAVKGGAFALNLLTSGDVTVDAGGAIDVTGVGIRNGGTSSATYGDQKSSASHGGMGKGTNAKCYGDVRHPTACGSGGHNSYWDGYGGGPVFLSVGRVLTVNGAVRSNGTGMFGASGGSVWLTAATISGTGTIAANGSGNGAGGRIALYQTAETDWSAFAGTVQAKSGNDTAGPGTVYRECAADPAARGELVVDNAGNLSLYCGVTSGTPEMSEPFGRVLVTNGVLCVGAGCEFVVTNLLTVAKDGRVESADMTGAVRLDPPPGGAMTVNVSATGTFSPGGLVCTNAGSRVVFTGDGDAGVAAGGRLQLVGAEESVLELCPATPSGEWRLNAGENVATEIRYVSVSNSTASGAALTAYESEDRGGNVNWSFLNPVKPGDPIVWTGAKDTAWSDGGNWSPKRLPEATDKITVPAGCGNYPVITAVFTANVFRVASGAFLTLDGGDLTVTNGFTCAGSLTCRGGETLRLTGDATFAGCTLSAGDSTLELCGTETQEIDPAGLAFANVLVSRPEGGAVRFTDGWTLTGDFRCRAVTDTTLAFAVGQTFAPAKLHLNGLVSGAEGYEHRLSLVSTTVGTAWKLKAAAGYDVRGVRVQDSDARSGVELKVGGTATDDGRNQGWDFGETCSCSWTGAGGNAQFDNPTNWCPAVVPGAGTVVRIATTGNETLAVTITGETARAFAALTLDTSSGGSVTMTSRGALVLGDTLDVPTRTTLVLDATNELNEVTGSVILRTGATLTHSQGDSCKLRLKVTGDMTVESGASVNVTGKGYRNAPPSTPQPASLSRSHGSAGSGQPPITCYGSVFRPVTHGAGGWGGDWACRGWGGGVVYLSVAGNLNLSGSVTSGGSEQAGAGGSVWLTAGMLRGTGPISANGTSVSPSGAGRIALYQTAASDWSAYTGTVSAGTVYREHAGDGAGGGEIRTSGNAALPMPDDGGARSAYAKATLRAYNGTVTITNVMWNVSANRLKLRDLVMDTGSTLVLSGSVVVVSSMEHKDGLGWPGGKYKQIVYEGEGGRVEWRRSGFTLIVR